MFFILTTIGGGALFSFDHNRRWGAGLWLVVTPCIEIKAFTACKLKCPLIIDWTSPSVGLQRGLIDTQLIQGLAFEEHLGVWKQAPNPDVQEWRE